MAAALSATRTYGATRLAQPRAPPTRPVIPPPRRNVGAVCGNKSTGGIFAPIVVVTRNIVGTKRFNQFRGKGISLHSDVIAAFCKQVGADSKRKQGLIRMAKKNGEKLGFLA